MSRGSKTITAVGVIVAVIALVLWWRGRGDDRPADEAGASAAPTPAAAARSASTRSGGKTPADRRPGLPNPTSVEQLKLKLDDYKEIAVYPPWSRPHDEGTQYKLAWNEPIISDLPFSDEPGNELMFHFGSDRAHVMFGEPLTSWIEVWRKGDPTRRVEATIEHAWVMSLGGAKPGRTVPLSYGDLGLNGDERAGDHRYTARLVPSEHEELATARQVRIEADVTIGDLTKRISRDFTYAPRPVLEILAVRDALANGSLVIELDVEVFEPGLHTIEANLMDGAGQLPIAYVDNNYPLAAGKETVELVFFGKAIRESGVGGPYLVRDLRGFLRDTDGGTNIWWSDPRTHTTERYLASDFSDAEWDSEEKREKIQAFESLIEATASGAIGGPTDDPESIQEPQGR